MLRNSYISMKKSVQKIKLNTYCLQSKNGNLTAKHTRRLICAYKCTRLQIFLNFFTPPSLKKKKTFSFIIRHKLEFQPVHRLTTHPRPKTIRRKPPQDTSDRPGRYAARKKAARARLAFANKKKASAYTQL